MEDTFLQEGYREILEEEIAACSNIGIVVTSFEGKFFIPPEEQVNATTLYNTQMKSKILEKAVDQHIREVCNAKGYDSENSLSKYMARPNSPWYAECIALGDWIDACWIKCHEALNAVTDGERTIPTAEELLAELPEGPQ
jgi:hypothetical protein